jgi:hypothetical protein
MAVAQTQSRHFGAQKNLLPLPGFEPRIFQPVAQSLYWLNCPDSFAFVMEMYYIVLPQQITFCYSKWYWINHPHLTYNDTGLYFLLCFYKMCNIIKPQIAKTTQNQCRMNKWVWRISAVILTGCNLAAVPLYPIQWTGLGLNQGLCSDRLETNCLSHVTTSSVMKHVFVTDVPERCKLKFKSGDCNESNLCISLKQTVQDLHRAYFCSYCSVNMKEILPDFLSNNELLAPKNTV